MLSVITLYAAYCNDSGCGVAHRQHTLIDALSFSSSFEGGTGGCEKPGEGGGGVSLFSCFIALY